MIQGGPKGTEQNIKDCAAEAKEQIKQGKKDVSVKGVKGTSWLMTLKYFNVAEGVAIDHMHGVLLGVQNLLLNLWFGADHSSENFSIKNLLKDVDDRLLQI